MGARSKDDPGRQPERSPAKGPTGKWTAPLLLATTTPQQLNPSSSQWTATAVVSLRCHRLSWGRSLSIAPRKSCAEQRAKMCKTSSSAACDDLGRLPWPSRSPQIFMSSAANGCNRLRFDTSATVDSSFKMVFYAAHSPSSAEGSHHASKARRSMPVLAGCHAATFPILSLQTFCVSPPLSEISCLQGR